MHTARDLSKHKEQSMQMLVRLLASNVMGKKTFPFNQTVFR